jgi:rod shape-determining protein MreD
VRRLGVFLLALLTAVLLIYELALSFPILGAGPDVILLVVVAFATGERPASAATYGFIGGFVRDLLLSSPKGISAFAYAATGYVVGIIGEVRGVWALIAMTAGATFLSQLLYGLGALVLSQNSSLKTLPRVALATTAYNTLLAPFLIPLLRRFAVPAGKVTEGGTAP